MSSSDPSYSATAEVAMVRTRRTRRERVWRNLKSAPLSAWFGLIVISIYAFIAIFAPFLAPYGEAEIFPIPYAPWGDEFIFCFRLALFWSKRTFWFLCFFCVFGGMEELCV